MRPRRVVSAVAVLAAIALGCDEGRHDGVALAQSLAQDPPRHSSRIDAPCAGCTLDMPATDDVVPLLVVMHGDRETADAAAERWRAVANERGWAVLSLQCPVDQGCKDSWWQWAGDPSWVTRQVASVTESSQIDRSRIYLIGWSGGGSYIGMYAQRWQSTFAAVVIHGGGQAPSAEACPAQPLPAYFLVGDANPSHRAAKDLRAYFEKCGQDVAWDLLEGADHAQEKAALDLRKSEQIVDWLAKRPRDRVSIK